MTTNLTLDVPINIKSILILFKSYNTCPDTGLGGEVNAHGPEELRHQKVN